MIVLSVLTSVAGGVVKQVVSLAGDQLRLDIVWGFKKELMKLKESSTLIADILHDAAGESEDPGARAEWMKRLVSVAYDAEDILDDFDYRVLRIVIKETRLDKKMIGFFNNNPLLFRLQMARKIYKINSSLKDLNKQAAGVGLVMTRRSNGGAAPSQGIQDRETTSFLEKNEFTFKDAIIIGRDEVVSNIVATLTSSNNQEKVLSVVAIVGLGGIGKTTLARSVTKQLKEGEVAKYFDTMLWVYVSNIFDVNSILRRMVESCDQATTTNLTSREALIKRLLTVLKNKRIFIVLDDVWNEEKRNWDDLKNCLLQLNLARGSTVMVTSRSAKVASIMEALPCWDLETLSDDECWSILKDRALVDSNASIASELEDIGKEIAKKCAGLPLAAKVLGSLMRSKSSTNEWLSILENQIWQLSSDNEDSRIMSILRLSFDNLKPPLKQCFAYCSMLVRGSIIERDYLIQLWMAQGLLHSHDHKRKQEIEMEDVGNMYFDTLLENSLFQNATDSFFLFDTEDDGVITTCKMHDLVHDLAIEVSKCESLTPEITQLNQEMDDMIRHVAWIPASSLELIPKTSISRLRSLLSNDQVSSTIFSKLKALRVLSICDSAAQELTVSLGKLKHLRYLEISGTGFKVLPKCIGKLYNLQTLKLPMHLEKCPKEIRNLINLRHLDFYEELEFEAGILGRLTKLQTLPYFKVGKEMGPTIEELGGLNQLRGYLNISELQHVRDSGEAKNARLVQKSHLRELTLGWTNNAEESSDSLLGSHILPEEFHTDVLDGLEPHGNLQSLEITNFMGSRFSSWIMSLRSLKKIGLFYCHNCEVVPALGHLPNLTSLHISRMDRLECVGIEFYGYSNISTTLFPALKILDIMDCGELIEWMEAPRISAGGEVVVVFPCLEELKLTRCGKLRNAPSCFPCLKRLEIDEMLSMGHNLITGMLNSTKSLTRLSIHWSDELTCINPDLSDGLLVLEELDISMCPCLEFIRIVHGIPSLRHLKISSCWLLSSLEVGLDSCTSLQLLHVTDCPNLMSIPITQGIPSLRELNISKCGLSSLGSGLDYYTSLEMLNVIACPNLMSIPITQGMPSLRELNISECGISSLGSGLDFCTSLQLLDIRDCPNLMSIPITQGMPSLRILYISWCGLSSLGSGLDYCTSLEELSICGCQNLASIPITQGITSLRKLSIFQCERLLSIPTGLQFCTSLEYLHITDCSRLIVPSGVDNLLPNSQIPDNVRQMLVCGILNNAPTGVQRLTNLKKLAFVAIGAFWEELDAFPDFQFPPQLEELHLQGWPKLRSLPQQIQYSACLKDLKINNFEGLEALPEWLGKLTSLECLTIKTCGNLKYLPTPNAMTSLTKLKTLHIQTCPLLKERCTVETGPEWHKISHIPNVYMR